MPQLLPTSGKTATQQFIDPSGNTIYAMDQFGVSYNSSQDGVAAAGTTQGNATVLPPRMQYNVTSGTGGVVLPISLPGASLTVANNAGAAINVYPSGTEKINALAAGAAFSAASATVTIFYCFTAGQWYTK